MSKSILILGGTGFLGSALRRTFSADPAFDVFISSTRGDSSDQHHCKIDLLNPKDVAAIGTYDVVINATGQVAQPVSRCVALNTTGMQHLLDAVAATAGLFVQISTTQVYGSAQRVTEDSPLQPETEYAEAKIAAENAVLNAGLRPARSLRQAQEPAPKNNNAPRYLILRLCNLYGAGQGKGLLWHLKNALQKNLLLAFADNDGSLQRHFLHVDDAAVMIHDLVVRGANGIFNIASSETFTIKQLITLLEKIRGTSLTATYADVRPIGNIGVIDIGKLEGVVPLSATHTVEEYLRADVL